MIKRRFYRQDHGDKDDFSDSSSSSSSDSDVEAQSSGASEEAGEEAEEVSQQQQEDELSDRVNLQVPSSSSSSSGGESEDRSADELDADSSGKNEKHRMVMETLAKDTSLPDGVGKWILKSKSVFKCRLCPKVVCLNEETLKTHIKSKRHARSEKLLSNGKLKHMLNSDGEDEVVESDGETHAERHARILALAQPTSCQEEPKKRPHGRQRQRLRMKWKQEINNPSSKETTQKVVSKKTSQKVASNETSLKVSTKETGQKVKRRRQNV